MERGNSRRDRPRQCTRNGGGLRREGARRSSGRRWRRGREAAQSTELNEGKRREAHGGAREGEGSTCAAVCSPEKLAGARARESLAAAENVAGDLGFGRGGNEGRKGDGAVHRGLNRAASGVTALAVPSASGAPRCTAPAARRGRRHLTGGLRWSVARGRRESGPARTEELGRKEKGAGPKPGKDF